MVFYRYFQYKSKYLVLKFHFEKNKIKINKKINLLKSLYKLIFIIFVCFGQHTYTKCNYCTNKN